MRLINSYKILILLFVFIIYYNQLDLTFQGHYASIQNVSQGTYGSSFTTAQFDLLQTGIFIYIYFPFFEMFVINIDLFAAQQKICRSKLHADIETLKLFVLNIYTYS